MAAEYVQNELIRREVERENRDREFWTRQLGGEVPSTEMEEMTVEEVITE